MTSYWAEFGWLDGAAVAGLRLVAEQGRWVTIEPGVHRSATDTELAGLVLPGLANTHSHAFHRALRGRTHDGGGTFWTWREQMYAIAGRLEPDSYYRLARAAYAEMALAGVSAVGEFHYLHHRADGTGYQPANEFGRVLIQAAAEAGIRICLLDTCYLAGGLDQTGYAPLSGVHRRFSDGSAAGWRDRVTALAAEFDGADRVRIGAAIHSVRAVPDDQLAEVLRWAAGRPVHAHVSEQPAENQACLRMHGRTPTRLLAEHGFGGPLHTAVHATHLTEDDIAWYGSSQTTVSFCPSTERDLADGIGPASALAAAGARLSLGSDQNATVDLLAEAQALELDDRLASLRRGRFSPAALVDSLTTVGQASLGFADAGRFAVGQRADLVAIRLDTVRTAGVLPGQAIMAAGAPDVHTVLVDGQLVVSEGRHRLGDVGALLAEAIAAVH
ncbi:MAG TPA: formimidoylglutamate deiminase [Jatrophihabitans sp.]|jgi:formiminoglutamate deiminase|nr:formimidoylglutamate deiminase [Jatrophihabitans sp.]